METKYRHEVKHVIDRFEAAELRPRLRAVMPMRSPVKEPGPRLTA